MCIGHDNESVPYRWRVLDFYPTVYESDIAGAGIIKKPNKENRAGGNDERVAVADIRNADKAENLR